MENVFEFATNQNRSERATQAAILVPALSRADSRAELLSRLSHDWDEPIGRGESDASTVWHFVWPLRDSFSYEREYILSDEDYSAFIARWVSIMGLPNWARTPLWWAYPGSSAPIVHPCHREIGWTVPAIQIRRPKTNSNARSAIEKALVNARRVMNTECDCLIQTPRRFVVVECKDKTGFRTEQTTRQKALIKSLERLLSPKRGYHTFVARELADETSGWTWSELEALVV